MVGRSPETIFKKPLCPCGAAAANFGFPSRGEIGMLDGKRESEDRSAAATPQNANERSISSLAIQAAVCSDAPPSHSSAIGRDHSHSLQNHLITIRGET